MMRRVLIAGVATLACGACATSSPSGGFPGERTVFDNPYVSPEVARGAVGPDQCDDCIGSDKRWREGLFYPGAGNIAYDREGNRIELSRSERRAFRERQRAIDERARQLAQQQAELPPPPEPTAPPLAIPPASDAEPR